MLTTGGRGDPFPSTAVSVAIKKIPRATTTPELAAALEAGGFSFSAISLLFLHVPLAAKKHCSRGVAFVDVADEATRTELLTFVNRGGLTRLGTSAYAECAYEVTPFPIRQHLRQHLMDRAYRPISADLGVGPWTDESSTNDDSQRQRNSRALVYVANLPKVLEQRYFLKLLEGAGVSLDKNTECSVDEETQVPGQEPGTKTARLKLESQQKAKDLVSALEGWVLNGRTVFSTVVIESPNETGTDSTSETYELQ